MIQATQISLRSIFASLCVGLLMVIFPAANAKTYRVQDKAAYNEAVKQLGPGDKLVLANGVWRDFEIVFAAHGEKDAPIALMAETPGKVIISGKSNLRLGGEYLVVSGLVFRDGYSPTQEVISFRRDSDTVANNSRLSDTIIDRFNNPDRSADDHWIAVYGKNNRIDNNYLAGKTTTGPTMVVRLDTPESRENAHVIENNFFGHRPPLGGNGGETIRIGVSDYSRITSNTFIVRNYFERSDGEVEIISIKSEGNTISENVFFESRGAVVLRHGGNNTVSRNVFFGNGVSDTGGVRVINDNQRVTENYFEGLRGAKFLSALTVMNGVPNSPENRYHQVENAVIKNNSLIDVAQIGFGVGSDEERSAAPINSFFLDNLIVTDSNDPVSVFDDLSGIRFAGNISDNAKIADFGASVQPELSLVRAENGLLYPSDESITAGAPRDLAPLNREDAGPAWFKKPPQSNEKSRTIKVRGGAKALQRALEKAQPGGTVILTHERYELDGPLVISSEVTLTGQDGSDKPVLSGTGESLIELRAGAVFIARNIQLHATDSNTAMISARGEAYSGTYSLGLKDVDVAGATSAHDIALLRADPETFAQFIRFDAVSVSDWPGAVISMSGDGLEGWYLADDIDVSNSQFDDIDGPLIEFGREGRDESTFGPRVKITATRIHDVGSENAAIVLNGVDGFDLTDSSFADAGAIRVQQRVLGLPFVVDGNTFQNTPALEIFTRDGELMKFEAARAE